MINDYIFDFAYGEALGDLYWRKKAGVKEEVEKCQTIRECVKDYADKVVEGSNPQFYEYAEKIGSIIIQLKYNDYTQLSFGNVQKLINLTMKYLYIKYYDTKRENFRCCHAPMDDIMRDIVGKAYRKTFGKNLGISEVAWSSVDKNAYAIYQRAINELIKNSHSDCLPIEFDYLNWGKKYPEEELMYDLFK